MLRKLNQYADYIGITGSALCLIHCIATSGLTIISSMVSHSHEGSLHSHEMNVWGWIDLSMVIISIIAVRFAVKSAHSSVVKKAFWSFLVVFVLTVLLKQTSWHTPFVEILSYIGSIGLIGTHFYNLYECHYKQRCLVN